MTEARRASSFHLWLDAAPRAGADNMAIDQALLDLAAEEGFRVLRLYHWSPFCLSFGRHEPASRRYGRERVRALGLDAVRRPTGGRAVWHARELTYAVAAPLDGESLRTTYLRLHALLLLAVRALGAGDASMADRPSRTPAPGEGLCFDRAVGGEILAGGRKVLGSAQVRQAGAFLQHGSLLLEDDQAPLREFTGQASAPAPEAPLARVIGRPVSFEAASIEVVRAFEAADWPGPDVARVLDHAARHRDRFRSAEWTWER